MLFYMINVPITFALVGITQEGCLYVSLIPFVGKGLLNDTLPVEGIGCYSEETIDYCSACDAHIVSEIPIGLIALTVVVANLSKVAGRFPEEHLVGKVTL